MVRGKRHVPRVMKKCTRRLGLILNWEQRSHVLWFELPAESRQDTGIFPDSCQLLPIVGGLYLEITVPGYWGSRGNP